MGAKPLVLWEAVMNPFRISVGIICFALIGVALGFSLFEAHIASVREELAKEEIAVQEMNAELHKAIESQKRDLSRRFRPKREVESVVEYEED